MSEPGSPALREEPRPWIAAAVWLACLAPLFYLSYGFANAMAASRPDVPSVVFAWERHIPFLGWTIVPYWSINVFYGLSLFICSTRAELETHVRRLLTAQIVAVACFLAFPLRFTLHRPETDGLSGTLFTLLASFDRPFNQAPSLHIALLVILWQVYARHLPRAARGALHLWFSLVAVSVLTTYQHHFLDIPTGALLGAFCVWLWPQVGPSPLATMAVATDRRSLIVAGCYLTGSASYAAAGAWTGGAGLWLLWPALSLLLVAASYAFLGAAGFQKDVDGRMSVAVRLLLAPYLLGAFVNSRSWTRREPRPVAIADGVWLGRIPSRREAARFTTVVDLCAELPGAAAPASWRCVPMLDLVPPPPAQLRDAAASIERCRAAGPLLVCCALGYSRSAAAVATWLVTSNAAASIQEAIERIRRARPHIVIDSSLRDAIGMATKDPGRNRVVQLGRRGARPARREERAYREYVSDEQRSPAGCIGGRSDGRIPARVLKTSAPR